MTTAQNPQDKTDAVSLVNRYLAAHPPVTVETDEFGLNRPANGTPHLRDNHLHISADHFARWLRANHDLQTGPNAAVKILKEATKPRPSGKVRTYTPNPEGITHQPKSHTYYAVNPDDFDLPGNASAKPA